jgi:anti-sigma B factor antagonist
MTVTQTPFDIDTARDGQAARLVLSGELDLATVPRVEQAVAAALAQGARTLIVDLGGLGFIDSSGLRLLIVLHQRAIAEGWTLSLIRPLERAMTVFKVSGLEENLPFAEKSSLA